MARGMDFRKARLGEYTVPSSFSLCQFPPEVSHCSGQQDIGKLRKGL